MDDVIRRILRDNASISVDAATIGPDEDLYECGLTSHACVNVMLALEDEYDFEFPDRLLNMTTFQTIHNLAAALSESGVSV